MKVILLQNVKGSGKAGDIVNVSDGYAKNYLIKNNLAKIATSESIGERKSQVSAEQYHKEQERLAAVNKAKEMEGLVISLNVKCGENGKVFGAITTKEIAEGFKVKGFIVDKRKIDLKEPIKYAGTYNLEVKLYVGVVAKFKLEVGIL